MVCAYRTHNEASNWQTQPIIYTCLYTYVWVCLDKQLLPGAPATNGELLFSEPPTPDKLNNRSSHYSVDEARRGHSTDQTRNGCRGVMEHKAKINPISEWERKYQVSLDKIVSK